MKNVFRLIKNFFIGIWDFIFYLIGAPYEEQAKKLKWDEKDAAFRGPENPKTKTIHYRANKVSKPS
ncbi:hypothetical protein PF327_03590 [Sulfurovum sp. XTW-4]|uniref:Uncharacterized protein n=1 Tax=Sulfurovum xiamenensis TaxID=3019066 RepID=A0ABT7QRU5_9BACT|nr:hypothetical protein [Sulfurovum xiamenensis]MDM5263269.1 hypothetical protein [Sulfurovum xiamenensis]